MEAHPTATLADVTPTGSQTQVITPDEVPEQVNHLIQRKLIEKCISNKNEVFAR